MNIFIDQHLAEKLTYIVHVCLLLLSLAEILQEKMQGGECLLRTTISFSEQPQPGIFVTQHFFLKVIL